MSILSVSEISDTRSAILKAAIDLFVVHNYEAVSIRQIADAANCNMGAISYHFGGKAKLYEACFDSLDIAEFLRCLAVLDDAANSMEFNSKLKLFIMLAGQFAVDHRRILGLYVKENYSQTPRIKDIKNRIWKPAFEQIYHFFQKAVEKEIVRADVNIFFIVRTLLMIIKTEFVFEPSTTQDLKNISEEFINLCNRSIYER